MIAAADLRFLADAVAAPHSPAGDSCNKVARRLRKTADDLDRAAQLAATGSEVEAAPPVYRFTNDDVEAPSAQRSGVGDEGAADACKPRDGSKDGHTETAEGTEPAEVASGGLKPPAPTTPQEQMKPCRFPDCLTDTCPNGACDVKQAEWSRAVRGNTARNRRSPEGREPRVWVEVVEAVQTVGCDPTVPAPPYHRVHVGGRCFDFDDAVTAANLKLAIDHHSAADKQEK